MQHGLQGQQCTAVWCWLIDGALWKECSVFELIEHIVVFLDRIIECRIFIQPKHVYDCPNSIFHRFKLFVSRHCYCIANLSIERLCLHGLLQ